ncbi:MAG: four helix bundle protein [Chitinophagaceae bacterium]
MLKLSHKQLDVYQYGLKLVTEVYELTKTFPSEERYLLVNQLRRAVVSVCSNLAEGAARKSKKETVRFYEISRSSLVEIDTQIEISLLLQYLKANQIKKMEEYLESCFRMMSKMISNIELGLSEADKRRSE